MKGTRQRWFGISAAMFMLMAAPLAALTAYAENYPDELMGKVNALRADGEAKKEMPASLSGIQVLSGDEVYKLWKGKKAVFLDTRSKADYGTERIPGAVNLLTQDLIKDQSAAASLDKEKEYLLYCNGAT